MAELKKAFFGEHVFKGVYPFHLEWPIIAKGKSRSIVVGFIVLRSIWKLQDKYSRKSHTNPFKKTSSQTAGLEAFNSFELI